MSGPRQDARSETEALNSLGYAQELARRMSGFSNFALTFSVIGLLLGLTANFQAGFSVVGGAAVGVDWIVGGLFALIVAASLGQIASAYPTAGGLYHWSAILGGRGWGWATAWLNLISYVFSLASVDVALYGLFNSTVLTGVDTSGWGLEHQVPAVIGIGVTQALLNIFEVRLLARLSDLGAWLNLFGCALLFGLLLFSLHAVSPGALFQFTNYSGDPGGGVVPASQSPLMLFGLALIFPLWIMTSFDAAAHASEETVDAARNVPRAMITSVAVSWVIGFVMAAAFVFAMQNPAALAKLGPGLFGGLLDSLPVPGFLKRIVSIAVVVTTYLCGLCILTGCSRAMYAFARDGGLPRPVAGVSRRWRTPVAAIWLSVALAVAATLYSPAFTALSAGTALFYYVSYAMPVAAGALALRRGWSRRGPFTLGALFAPAAVLVVAGAAVLVFVGLQPPNDVLRVYAVIIVVGLVAAWFGSERRRFPGPPLDAALGQRRADIDARERAVGETA